MVKEYTRVKKDGLIILRLKGFKPVDKMLKMLRNKEVWGNFEIEYLLLEKGIFVYAIHYFTEYLWKGALYPNVNYRSAKRAI